MPRRPRFPRSPLYGAHIADPNAPVATGRSPQPTTHHAPSPPQFGGFQPWQAPPYPTGTYDPSLDAQLGAARRGYHDLQGDTQIQDTRDTVDYGTQRSDIQLQQDRGLQDFASQTAALDRAYQALSSRQGQQIDAAGLGSGGASLQAAMKRQINEQIDAQPIATGTQRLNENSDLSRARLALEYAPPGEGNPLGGRRFQDRQRTLTRAGRELAQYGIDITALKGYEAGGAGYTPPGQGQPGGMPSNETVGPGGTHLQTHVVNGVRYFVDRQGRIVRSVPLHRATPPPSGRPSMGVRFRPARPSIPPSL